MKKCNESLPFETVYSLEKLKPKCANYVYYYWCPVNFGLLGFLPVGHLCKPHIREIHINNWVSIG